jgi:hypothetical protein
MTTKTNSKHKNPRSVAKSVVKSAVKKVARSPAAAKRHGHAAIGAGSVLTRLGRKAVASVKEHPARAALAGVSALGLVIAKLKRVI